jgi:hypothetical protein
MYIAKKLELISQYASGLNVLLIANIRFTDTNDNNKIMEIAKNFQANDYLIKQLCEKYDIKINYIDLTHLKSFKKTIVKFLSFVYVRKSKPKRGKARNTTISLFKPVEVTKPENNNLQRRSYSNTNPQDEENVCII